MIPPADALLGLLDPDSLTLGPDPAVFRMPSSPLASEAGACAAAARVLLACRNDLVPPAFVDPEEALRRIEDASCMALMLGGEDAFLAAAGILSDPVTWIAAPDPEEIPLIVVEDEGE